MSTFEDSAPLVEALRENIREAKRKSGLTIDRLADEAGISRTAVIKLLSNSKIDPKLTDIAALCRYFDLSLDRVFSLHSEAAPPPLPSFAFFARNSPRNKHEKRPFLPEGAL